MAGSAGGNMYKRSLDCDEGSDTCDVTSVEVLENAAAWCRRPFSPLEWLPHCRLEKGKQSPVRIEDNDEGRIIRK